MVSCQEPSPLKESKNSLQRHPHDAVQVNAHSFMSMGVKARCCPCHSAAHCRHIKRQPSLCQYCHRRGYCHCDRHRRLCLHCHLCCRCRCHCPLPFLSRLAIAVVVTINQCRRHLCCIAISHCCCRHPCHQPLPSPSPLAIAVAISIGHHRCRRRWPLLRVVALARQELYSKKLSKECLPSFILFGQWVAH
jgi:hypothetical protein